MKAGLLAGRNSGAPGLYATMLAHPDVIAAWNYDEASGQVQDGTGNGNNSTTVGLGGGSYQGWTGPDGVDRISFGSNGLISIPHNSEFNPAQTTGGAGLTAVMAVSGVGAGSFDLITKSSSSSDDVWELTFDGTNLFVRLGRSASSGAHRIWWNSTWTPPTTSGTFVIAVYIQETSATTDLPVVTVNGVDVTMTYITGGGSWDSAASSRLAIPGDSVSYDIGPACILAGQADLTDIWTAADDEGWY